MNCLKFLLVFFFVFLTFSQTKFPKIIWTYWTGQQIPYFSQLCLANIRQMTEKDGWVINIVNDVTIYEFIQDDNYFNHVISSNVLTTNLANKADIVRLFLMYENGGVWLDISTILIQDFTWLDKLADNQYVFNRKEFANFNQYPDVFLFLAEHFGGKKQQTYWKTGQKVLAQPGFQTWFIACIPKARLLYEWKKQFTQYYLKDFETYFQKGVKQEIYQRNLDYNTYMTTGGALQNVIQTKQRQLDQNRSYFAGKQFAVHHYKLWVMWSQIGPLFFNTFVTEVPLFITQYSIQYLKKEERYPKYFIKIIKSDRLEIDKVLQKIMKKNFTENKILVQKKQQITCENKINIVEGSILDKYLFSKLPKDKYKSIFFINHSQYHQKCQNLNFYFNPSNILLIQISSFLFVSCFLLFLALRKNQLAKFLVKKKC